MEYKTQVGVTGGIVLASSHIGCIAYEGEFDGVPAAGGDCSHIDISQGAEIIMTDNEIYAGNVTMIHKTIPAEFDQCRTVVRLILPDDYVFAA